MTIELPLMFLSGFVVLLVIFGLYFSRRKNLRKDNDGRPGSAIGL